MAQKNRTDTDNQQKSSTQLKRPTIFDLEAYTGFSRSTISRAFNPDASVKPDTRENILRAADEIGFSLHPGAKMIRSKRSYRWGLLLPHLENPEYAELVKCFDAEARRLNTHLMLGLTHYDPSVESTFLKHWAAGEADGVICNVCGRGKNDEVYKQLLKRRYPLLGLFDGIPGISTINTNAYDSFCLGIRNLVELGHRRIAYVGLTHKGNHPPSTFLAYKDELERNKITIDDSLILLGENNQEAGAHAWRRLKEMDNAPTAIIAFNDILATGIWIGVYTSGLSIPKHLSIMSNDNIPEAQLMGITSVRYDHAQLAREAIAELERMRSDSSAKPRLIEMKTDLVMRGSIGRPGSRDKGWHEQ
ncbi:LacI family DNA-binding transcriptional regulator [Rubellicoccus peritrichatus]|uniref:LacI family DNA-binding transcriptional regulator n=1 Tax=Rubellicoccus peritrichatus TaxID=3080537 RepID=A0AAQ3L6A0_9BACT|nr:LacI family DNA-binding transcriptional regulator [Puniceicoccus sp. CR14]WOO39726.1 LacI family DNA-binding transcriptional regulator [Puniceicoccus sp. CR14]